MSIWSRIRRAAVNRLQPGLPRVVRWLSQHRGLVVLFGALPASFVYEQTRTLRDRLYERFGAAPEKHGERVRHVQAQVRRWNREGGGKPMCTARPEWLTVSPRTATYKRDCARIEIDLRDVLEIDEARRVVRLEPLVNMGQLTRYLVPRGWALEIMVEMEDLTVGGLVMGTGMETSCHRHGLIHETVVSYEMVLPDGSLRQVTRESDPALFHALPWSHGTLGFLTAVELKIRPIEPTIYMKYIPCHSMAELASKMRELSLAEDTPDLLEGTIYSAESGVIQCGWYRERPADGSDGVPVNPINRWYKPWFYKHVERALREGPFEEWVPARDYYHRHTRSIFWELEELVPFGNHPLYRHLLGWLGAPKVSLLKRTMTEEIRRRLVEKHVVQDIVIPIRSMEEAVSRFDAWFGIYPLLVFPIRLYDHGELTGFLPRPRQCEEGESFEMYFDLGVYGIPPAVKRGEPWSATESVRAMEAFTQRVHGFSLLYADIFMTREEFEQMFDHRLYREQRERLGAVDAFPEVWDKVRPQYALQPAARADGEAAGTQARSAAGAPMAPASPRLDGGGR